MKIGEFVRRFIPKVLAYCEKQDPQELMRLGNATYSKKHLNINFPFLMEMDALPSDLSRRYWVQEYIACDKTIRICSQWYETNKIYFIDYLTRIGIEYDDSLLDVSLENTRDLDCNASMSTVRLNSRYKGNAIGNAQNAVVRNILSNLGLEQFSENDWQNTKAYFDHKCVYCGQEVALEIDHAIPINKKYLGEHRLGNLVPSCGKCNSVKGSKDFREFLGKDKQRIQAIEAYMDSRNYAPLANNEQVQVILEMVYGEVGSVAERYVQIINQLFLTNDN
jgi:hypothetical protein